MLGIELRGFELRTHMLYPGLLLCVQHNPVCQTHSRRDCTEDKRQQ